MVFLLTSKACQEATTSSWLWEKIWLGLVTPLWILSWATWRLEDIIPKETRYSETQYWVPCVGLMEIWLYLWRLGWSWELEEDAGWALANSSRLAITMLVFNIKVNTIDWPFGYQTDSDLHPDIFLGQLRCSPGCYPWLKLSTTLPMRCRLLPSYWSIWLWSLYPGLRGFRKVVEQHARQMLWK